MNQQILIEHLTPDESHMIQETSKADGCLYMNGIMMQGGIKNRNGRVYPVQEIQNAVTSAQDRIKQHNGIFGELDHPNTLNINLDRVSHVITEMRMDGQNAVGKVKILNTPMGQIAKTLVESGVRVGVSSRGAGAVTESGDVSSFNFLTMDLVANPSAPDAMPNAMYESLQQDAAGRHVLSLAEQVREDPKAQKYLKEELLSFFDKLVKK